MNGKSAAGAHKGGSFAILTRRFNNGDLIHLTLPMEVILEEWCDGQAAAVVRGPLVYSLAIDEKRVEILRDTPRVERDLKGNLIQEFPALEFYPSSEWRYGVDRTLAGRSHEVKVVELPMTGNPFLSGHCPVHLEIPAHHLPDWTPHWTAEPAPLADGDKVAVKTPASPTPAELQTVQAATFKKMIPYGATHLRLTALPIIDAGSAVEPQRSKVV